MIHKAIDLGITLFDTADIYSGMGGSETVLGEVLGDRRKDIVLATKFSKPMSNDGTKQGASRRYIMSAVEASLKRLKTDYIDLYQQHDYDPLTLIEETLRALDELVRSGKVRHIGCSNFSGAQIAQAQHVAETNSLARLATAQDQYNLLSREIEDDVLPAIAAAKLALLPYFPLASGMLTGKYRLGRPVPQGTRLSNARYSDRFLNDTNYRIVETLETFCAARGRTLLQLAFAWLLAKPVVASVIAGASSPEQLLQNAKAVGWELTADEVAEVDRLTSR